MPQSSGPSVGYPVYTTTELARELRQAEIITGLVQYSYNVTEEVVETVARPFTIVLTQDCDLLQDFNAMVEGGNRDLVGVLLYEAELAGQVRARIVAIFGSELYRTKMSAII